jgi:D-Tyr-tRNA(Tyr) deacylase
MRAVAQRVSQASVCVDGVVIGAIEEPGLLVLVGVTHDDTVEKARRLAAKLWGLRVLDGEKSCSDLGAPASSHHLGLLPRLPISYDHFSARFIRNAPSELMGSGIGAVRTDGRLCWVGWVGRAGVGRSGLDGDGWVLITPI